jgi:hypothetical protein
VTARGARPGAPQPANTALTRSRYPPSRTISRYPGTAPTQAPIRVFGASVSYIVGIPMSAGPSIPAVVTPS